MLSFVKIDSKIAPAVCVASNVIERRCPCSMHGVSALVALCLLNWLSSMSQAGLDFTHGC